MPYYSRMASLCNRCEGRMTPGEDQVEILNPQGQAEIVHQECMEDGDVPA